MRPSPLSSNLRASGNFLLLTAGMGNSLLGPVSRQLLQRVGIGDEVHPAAHQQEADPRPGGRVVDRLIDADLVRRRVAFEEEVGDQIQDFPHLLWLDLYLLHFFADRVAPGEAPNLEASGGNHGQPAGNSALGQERRPSAGRFEISYKGISREVT